MQILRSLCELVMTKTKTRSQGRLRHASLRDLRHSRLASKSKFTGDTMLHRGRIDRLKRAPLKRGLECAASDLSLPGNDFRFRNP